MTAAELVRRLAEFPGGRWGYQVPDLSAHNGAFTVTLDTYLGRCYTGEAKTFAKALEEALRKADGDE
jgi:hypothetical protein